MPNKNILPNDFYIENIQYICLFMHTYTFTFFLLCWVFVSMHRLSLVAASRGYTLGAVHRLLIVGASLAAEHGLWGAWASVVVHVGLVAPWCVPEIKPVYPALAGGFLTIGPPGKSYTYISRGVIIITRSLIMFYFYFHFHNKLINLKSTIR